MVSDDCKTKFFSADASIKPIVSTFSCSASRLAIKPSLINAGLAVSAVLTAGTVGASGETTSVPRFANSFLIDVKSFIGLSESVNRM